MADNIYCGIGDIPKNNRRGTMKECVEKGQIRYYGIKKIDSVTLKSLKKKESGGDIFMKIFKLHIHGKKLAQIYKREKDEDKKKKLREEINTIVGKIAELRKKEITLKKKEEKEKKDKKEVVKKKKKEIKKDTKKKPK